MKFDPAAFDPAANKRLVELLADLSYQRRQLSDAELNGFEFIATNTLREIRRVHALIRRHCAEHGLPRPSDVPETDE